MTVESASFLSQLDLTLPGAGDSAGEGDDHLRLLKNCLIGDGSPTSGSFTPSFTGQYTGTADQLNLVNNPIATVASFIGRTGAVVAADSDYDADQVDYDPSGSALTATDVQAAIDELTTYKTAATEHKSNGFAATETNGRMRFSSFGTVSGRFATITNAAGTGWILTVTEKCVIAISAAVSHTGSAGSTVENKLAIKTSTGTIYSSELRNQVNGDTGDCMELTIHRIAEIGDTYTVHFDAGSTVTAQNAHVNLTMQAV